MIPAPFAGLLPQRAKLANLGYEKEAKLNDQGGAGRTTNTTLAQAATPPPCRSRKSSPPSAARPAPAKPSSACDLHHDHLGSVVGLTLNRGFTVHEHLDEMGVIHMNGRIYDPLIGRFMSADPFIPNASNLQAHNRFAYVYNNPLKFTDADGFKPFWKKKWFRSLFALTVGWFTMGAASAAIINCASLGSGLVAAAGYSTAVSLTTLGSVVAGAAGGFMAGLIGSGSLKGALQGAFTGGVFGAIGGLGAEGNWNTAQYVSAHAAAGCITSVAGGGQCVSGALSAAFGKFTTIQTHDWGLGVAQFSASVVAGGIGSVIGDGKFENGAMTAAYAYMFNNGLSMLRWAMFSSSTVIDNSDQNIKAAEESLRTNAQTAANNLLEAGKTGVAACGVVNPQ